MENFEKVYNMALKESTKVSSLASLHNWNIPTKCPVCGGDVDINDNHTRLYCINDYCPTKNAGTISKWVRTLDVKEFGPASISALQDLGLTTISDLYNKDFYDRLSQVEGFGVNSTNKMYRELLSHREMTAAKFVAGYNIRGVGEKVIEDIFERIPELTENFPVNLIKYNSIELTKLANKGASKRGESSITIEKLVNGIKANYDDMKKTLQYVSIKEPEAKASIDLDSKLEGKHYCFTGAASIPRKQLWQMVIDNGGVVDESVKSDTDFLVVADPTSNSGKVQAARKKGVEVISEEEFFNRCK